ncbi:hypothetical protein [Nocardia sp. bgisy134]
MALIDETINAPFGHIVFGLPAPYPIGTARWAAGELITAAP